MSDPIPIRASVGSYLATVVFYRTASGEITAQITDMPVHVIGAEDTISARFFRAAQWCLSGTLDLMRQGLRFDEEAREAKNDDDEEREQ